MKKSSLVLRESTRCLQGAEIPFICMHTKEDLRRGVKSVMLRVSVSIGTWKPPLSGRESFVFF